MCVCVCVCVCVCQSGPVTVPAAFFFIISLQEVCVQFAVVIELDHL